MPIFFKTKSDGTGRDLCPYFPDTDDNSNQNQRRKPINLLEGTPITVNFYKPIHSDLSGLLQEGVGHQNSTLQGREVQQLKGLFLDVIDQGPSPMQIETDGCEPLST